MKTATVLPTLWVLLLLGGCAAPPKVEVHDTLFADHLFVKPAQPVDPDQVFAMSDAMKAYLREVIEPLARRRGAQQALYDALYARGQLRLDYDNSRTRNAPEAFDARSGNCMSLLIMTGAFANALNLRVHFQSVVSEEALSRTDDLHIAIGHVNLRLGGGRHPSDNASMTIDFVPGAVPGRQRVREIEQARVLAMYMNNRAVEALVAGQLDEAYAWLRAGWQADPQFAAVYNTLGVIYLRRGALAEAEQALLTARTLEPRNPHALGNLVQTLQRQGRQAEASLLQTELQRLQPIPPFARFERGRQAMRDGNFRLARELFEAEIADAPDYHEFHFWLALAHLQLGETRDARKQLQAALDNSTTPAQNAIYASKLEKLKAGHP